MEDGSFYVPILKWRQGEYQSLMRLETVIKDKVVPLIVIPPVEYDFEEERPKKSVQEHISPFAKRYNLKWGNRKSLIDLHDSLENSLMGCGTKVVEYIFDELRANSSAAIPVVRLSHGIDFINSIRSVVSKDGMGAAFRIKTVDLMGLNLGNSMRNVASNLGLELYEIDLVIDLEVPQTFEPYAGYAKALSSAIKKIAFINDFRSFTVAGMSLNLSEIKRPGAEPVRHEWMLYKHLNNELAELRQPNFGDYTIETPDFISLDMRLLNPAGKIVYTTENTWLVSKGKSFRNDRAQMIEHCKTVVNSGHYCGKNFSNGDGRIYDTLHGVEGTGNQGTWKEVGVSHHITLIVNQLANFHAL